MGKIVVDRGLEEYTIEDINGKCLGKFSFNPSDIELVKRYEKVADAISHIADGVDTSKDLADIISGLEEKMYEQIDFLFNAEVSKDIFAITSPYSVLANGEFFIESVLDAISNLIEAETGKRYKKMQVKVNDKISKYTKKYHK